MESKLTKNLIPILLTVAVIVIGAFSAMFILSNISSGQKKPTPQQTKSTIEIDKKSYDNISSTNTESVNISLDQSGFGRENPFAPYK